MDQQSPPRTETESLAARSAAAVQALRDRAQKSLEERQSRLAELEERIAAQLDLVGAELAREAAIAQTAETSDELASIEEMRREFDRERDEWRACREAQEAEIAASREQIEQRTSELASESTELESHRVELEQQRTELEAAREQFRSEQEATERADREELEQLRSQLGGEEEKWQAEAKALESRLQEQSQQIEQLCQERDALQARIDDLEQAAVESASALREWEIQAAEWQVEREKLTDDRDRSTAGLDELRREWEVRAAEWQVEREKLAEDRDRLVGAAAEDLRLELGAAREQEAAARAELAEVTPKFDLALEDVRRLQERIRDLEQELADRPELAESDDSNLIPLQNERNALLERVLELESQLERRSSGEDGDSGQELSDLQRRFEMAVDDVRQLKTEKEKLEQQLKAARSTSAVAAEPAGSDWEVQKRMLLASLEGEEVPTPERQEERASIEDTIRITDDIIAEKDRILLELQAQLDAAANESPAEKVLRGDDLIRAERERLATLESEVNEKLRAAELELSTARAKLARQESELEKHRVELEALKNAGFGQAASGVVQAPVKRRWLDKLGLGGDDGK